MSENDQKLISDHKEVVETIRRFDKINLVNTSGDPVNEYDLEYRVKGYTIGKNGHPAISEHHRVKISLPFGYPHFHPVVKPLSRIYHPDIDEYAVRIAHYWSTTKSLAELVVHIGEMICGSYYSTENPFNEKAATYYRDISNRLPIDSIQNDPKPQPATVKSKRSINIVRPLLAFLLLVIIMALFAGGTVYFLDSTKLKASRELAQKAENNAKDLFYEDAEKNAKEALANLDGIIALKPQRDQLVTRINTLLNSREMQEGLQGKIEFEGEFLSVDTVHKLEVLEQLEEKASLQEQQGNTDEAILLYQEALTYAEDHNLQRGIEKQRRTLASLKLQKLLTTSEEAHKSQNWKWAVQEHQQVIDFITAETDVIDDAEKQLAKAKQTLLLDQIALYSDKASDAENADNLKEALKDYQNLINLINKAENKKDNALQTALKEAKEKKALLTEKLRIEELRQWLLMHYKIIFQAYYPEVIPESLRNPQALFVRYNGNKLLYDLNCLDKSGGSTAKLRIYYQYDLETDEWGVFRGTP